MDFKKITRLVYTGEIRKERKKMNRPRKNISTGLRQKTKAKQDHKCDYCGKRLGGPIHIHHKNFNRSDNRPCNLQALHKKCHQDLHSKKQNMRVIVGYTSWGEPIIGVRPRAVK